jgi:uncharacterized protein (TIGR01777 family)
LTDAIAGSTRPPRALISASAVGIYGVRKGDQILTEETPAADDFLARVCGAWERAAAVAQSRCRVVMLRTGLVLAQRGGALPRLALPFQFFAGGPVGSGRQWWSWIHVDDWVAMTRWALSADAVSGAINLTAPTPVTNRDFAATLGEVLRRPSWLTVPTFAIRAALGEMADALIVNGQRVMPARAVAGGFRFRYDTLEPALRAIYATRTGGSDTDAAL